MSGALAGCLGEPGGGDGNGGGGGSGGEDSTGTATESGMNLAIISGPGGFGDKAYNDIALQGLNKAVDEFGGSVNQVQGEGGQYGSLQSQLAESSTDYDLIVCVGFYQAEALKQSAEEFPDQNWMIINQGLFKENGDHFENVAGYVWANHEMSYLAGVAAGTMTSRELTYDNNANDPDGKTVGFVGGVDSALIRAFEEAYVKGVEFVDDSVDVKIGYAGSFEDPAAGKEVALSQYDEGADIIYHAAAGTGPGIFQAAQDRDRFAIGVDADQSVTLPDYSDVIIGSAVKFMNVGTYEVAKGIRDGNWSEVSGKHVVGLKEDGVRFVKGADLESELPDVLDENLADAKDGIVNGDITVPCSATGCN
ncbi:MAG: BMP family ABC transporter substrate-binding protein [Natronomonas sp.]|uniref:BMP family lipoprotein n=1 Tax=Natronomonas sp. TaxID=2184060 RepID=UPI0028701F44|nr:BMP family ABC transporter substrate-binding protein [Natronomonas sp.]MDR9382575.1 BMP family ABC transporter substrate-binding protein [Natronomonas sp.]MDR9430528.1 BMP family ABC transporter substrate-binding protein [Natronomonas sp.]